MNVFLHNSAVPAQPKCMEPSLPLESVIPQALQAVLHTLE